MFNEEEYFKEEFRDITLDREDLSGKTFEECKFVLSRFQDCNMSNCTFINCTFEECLLSATTVVSSRFLDCVFDRSKVIGIDWSRVGDIVNICFKKCELNYSNFRFVKLLKSNITDCKACEVDFTGIDLSNSILCGTDFNRSIFSNSKLSKCDFRNCINYSIDVRVNTVKGAKFSLPEALSLLNMFSIDIE